MSVYLLYATIKFEETRTSYIKSNTQQKTSGSLPPIHTEDRSGLTEKDRVKNEVWKSQSSITKRSIHLVKWQAAKFPCDTSIPVAYKYKS